MSLIDYQRILIVVFLSDRRSVISDFIEGEGGTDNIFLKTLNARGNFDELLNFCIMLSHKEASTYVAQINSI